VVLWSGTIGTIPAGYTLCDGTASTPDLRNKMIVGAGTTYTVNQTGGTNVGASTTNSPTHSHTMLATDAQSHSHSVILNTAGGHNHGGTTGGTALTVPQMGGHGHGIGNAGEISPVNSTVSATYMSPGTYFSEFIATTSFVGGSSSHSHSINADPGHGHNVNLFGTPHQHQLDTMSTDGLHTHTIDRTPPYAALAFIMKT
jgi:hypothetical protein